jgi:UDP-glucose 4-epimerase
VIPRFLKSALSGASLVIYGDGQQTRDFVYLDDVVNALVSASMASEVDGRVINVGSGKETSIYDLGKAVSQAVGTPIEPLITASQENGVPRMCADLTLAMSYLNYNPKVTLLDGLHLTLELDPRFR